MDQRLKKGYLQWRCRRGTKELDVILTAFLDGYESLTDKELVDFNQILDYQDTRLWTLLSDTEDNKHVEHYYLIQKIKSISLSHKSQ